MTDTPVTVAIISAAAAIVVPAMSFYLTKRKERQADWQRYKFEIYKELVQSLSGIVGTDSTPEGRKRFAVFWFSVKLRREEAAEGEIPPFGREFSRHEDLSSD